ncbi:Uncharacterised protein [Mycobacteroides abscessus subsp. abscessus]|nr:Uncharacterised protein [Mycobacteroides abscessus subsp. abscessus]
MQADPVLRLHRGAQVLHVGGRPAVGGVALVQRPAVGQQHVGSGDVGLGQGEHHLAGEQFLVALAQCRRTREVQSHAAEADAHSTDSQRRSGTAVLPDGSAKYST